MDIEAFFKSVITGPKSDGTPTGYLCIALLSPTEGRWENRYFSYPTQIADAVSFCESNAEINNVYFCPHLFSEDRSLRQNVLSSRTIVADLDHAEINNLPLPPSYLVRTSSVEGKMRHQAYWIVDEDLSLEELEVLSRNITYSIPECDRSGWPLGHKFRVPGTFNLKYIEMPTVEVVGESAKRFELNDLEMVPTVPKILLDLHDSAFLDTPLPDGRYPIGPQKLMHDLHDAHKIPNKVFNTWDERQPDRSKTLWGLLTALFRAGLDKEAVFWVAKSSPNNKFADLRWGADRELAKDVLRAEAVVKTKTKDPRDIILEARHFGSGPERKQHVARVVLDLMRADGDFIRTNDSNIWYIRKDVGRPIRVSKHSDYLETTLCVSLGLNPTEEDHKYVINDLTSYGRTLPITGVQSSLAYYDNYTNVMSVHTGKRDVIVVTPDDIKKVYNGTSNVVFPWSASAAPFSPSYDPLPVPWFEYLFGGGLDNVTNMDKEHALAMLRVWFMFLLFRNASVSRPILALFGQPGAGKSTMFRRIYTLIYGKEQSLSGVTNAEDFDHSVANDPLVVLDNVDTWERWLPDKLALSAAASDRKIRKLYTDADVIVLKRQAIVALTAHNPQGISRPDVADRLLIINLERLKEFRPEKDIMNLIYNKRAQIWGGIIQDIQKVLRAEMPKETEIPQFRIEDFAMIGCWIANGLGIRQEFEDALRTIQGSQRRFALDDNTILVDALTRWTATRKEADVWLTPSELFQRLRGYSRDATAFERQYKNAVKFSKDLVAMIEPMRDLFKIEPKFDSNKGSRVWRITAKTHEGEAA